MDERTSSSSEYHRAFASGYSLPRLVKIRTARVSDRDFVLDLIEKALEPYYGGDHRAHAERIFGTHVSGGIDVLGFFSTEQRMYILLVAGRRAGLIHIVGKRQGTYKISPIIIEREAARGMRLGHHLLRCAETYARRNRARQIYCTVALNNTAAVRFFLRHGYVIAGRSDSHYKQGVTEAMLYKPFTRASEHRAFDRDHISVLAFADEYESEVRKLLKTTLPRHFSGITDRWLDSLFDGYRRRTFRDVNLKFKLIFVAVDRGRRVLGVVGATPKKGEPIKLMPFVARTLPAFMALLTDIPYQLREYGRRLYMHITPTAEETICLQQRGWRLDAALPGAYRPDQVTQQWSLDLQGEHVMRVMRVKQRFLDLIRSGQKTLEVRVGYPNIKSIVPGERIRFRSREQTEIVIVRDVRNYISFSQMATKEDLGRVAPDISSQTGVLALLREIYPPDREDHGVVVLEIGLERQQHGQQEKDEGSSDRRRNAIRE